MKIVSICICVGLLLALTPGCIKCRITWEYHEDENRHYFYACDQLLAVYNNSGNTFIEFWYNGVNLLGGFSDSVGVDHDSSYPFGWPEGNPAKLQWEGFWSGYNYYDNGVKLWLGVPGNPFAQQSFTISYITDQLLDIHVQTRVSLLLDLYECDVHYYLSEDGIGVRNEVHVLTTLYPFGFHDTGGQLLMAQVDCDLDPASPHNKWNQPSLYYQLAADTNHVYLDPFPPYGGPTPSNTWTDVPAQTVWETPLPNTALVSSVKTMTFFTPFGRPDRPYNLALRIDLERSTLPQLEYYCEYNGEHDYLNFLYSPAVGVNRGQTTVPVGTIWVLYGDLIPWEGQDPEVLYNIPMLSDVAP